VKIVSVIARNIKRLAVHQLWSFLPTRKGTISYITEPRSWAIAAEGRNISSEIKESYGLDVLVSSNPSNVDSQIIHFGSQFMIQDWFKFIRERTQLVVSFFHGKYGDSADIDRNLDFLIENQTHIKRIVISFEEMRNRLEEVGIAKEKIVRVPIGLSTSIFSPIDSSNRKRLRESMGIPEGSYVFGSFQKDGVGWGKGTEPKLIKGPDLLIETLKILNTKKSIFVLLSGPARGFVIENLIRLGIPFKHILAHSDEEMADLYRCLDMYLITSREEGGPKGLLEALSSGCPVVTTPVGMALDLSKGNHFSITSGFTPAELVHRVEAEWRVEITHNEREELRSLVAHCDWKFVAKEHYEKVYKPLLDQRNP
jgi:glycosyltransferase involved in cell wall biosynthesis